MRWMAEGRRPAGGPKKSTQSSSERFIACPTPRGKIRMRNKKKLKSEDKYWRE